MEHNFIVEDLKIRLDRYLANQLAGVSRAQIQRDIEGGSVEVNGQPVLESKFVVRKSDAVAYRQSAIPNSQSEIVPTNTPLKILYNNHGLIIIDKPAGLTVHPGAGFKGETLASALLYHFKDLHVVGEDHRPGIVHRLDKDTSGVILVAATQAMYGYLKDAFAERKVKKDYIALVYGHVEKPHGFIQTPIGKSRADFRKQTTKNPLEAKEAVTEYRVLEYFDVAQAPGLHSGLKKQGKALHYTGRRLDGYTLLLVKLHTGRTHQIRLHFASIGHPLMGDELYGGKKSIMPGLNRQFLHAKRIEVQLPDKIWIEAESGLPEDLRKILFSLNSKVIKNL